MADSHLWHFSASVDFNSGGEFDSQVVEWLTEGLILLHFTGPPVPKRQGCTQHPRDPSRLLRA
eukprot:763556-Pyramimonas_sp.AAC.2